MSSIAWSAATRAAGSPVRACTSAAVSANLITCSSPWATARAKISSTAPDPADAAAHRPRPRFLWHRMTCDIPCIRETPVRHGHGRYRGPLPTAWFEVQSAHGSSRGLRCAYATSGNDQRSRANSTSHRWANLPSAEDFKINRVWLPPLGPTQPRSERVSAPAARGRMVHPVSPRAGGGADRARSPSVECLTSRILGKRAA